MFSWMFPPDNESLPLFSPISTQMASFTGVILNVILFILTLTCTKKQMQDYARVLRMHCLIDALLEVEIFVSVNQPFILSGYLYIITFSPFYDDCPRIIRMLQYCYYPCILYILTSLPIDFFYRYMAVCRQKILSIYKLAGMVFIAVAFSVIEGVPTSHFFEEGPSEKTQKETAILYNFMKWNLTAGNPKFLVVPALHPLSIFSFCLLSTIMIFLYIVIVYSVKKINTTVKQSTELHKSASFTRAHKHIHRILMVQSFVPMIICLPIVYLVIQETFGYESLLGTDITIMLGIWYIPGKTLCTILVVPSYRDAILWPVIKIYRIFRKKEPQRM